MSGTSSRKRWFFALATVALVVAAVSCDGNGGQKLEVASELSYKVKSIKLVVDHAGRLDWGPNDVIAFDSRGSDGYYDVFLMNPDGSDRRCLTCGKGDLIPQRHNGNPAWHPSGKYIVFQAEKAVHPGPTTPGSGGTPGAGYFCDLWVTTPEGDKFWKLNDVIANLAQGSLHPQFSHDGTKLMWAERLVNHPPATDDLGEWGIRVADFVTEPEPHLENVKLYQPGEQRSWYETHGFSPDDKSIIFSANPMPGQSVAGQDVATYNLETGDFKNLTNTMRDWEEQAHWSPDGKKISYMGNTGLGNEWRTFMSFMNWLKTELFLMDPDGSNLQQMTHFNEKGYPESTGYRTLFTDHAWSPDGTKIGALVDIIKPGVFEEWFTIIEFE